jgi:hypothetical protein
VQISLSRISFGHNRLQYRAKIQKGYCQMLKRLITALFLASSLWGYTSLVVPAGAFVRITIPAVAPFTSFGDSRLEVRFDNMHLPASGTQVIYALGKYRITIDPSGNLCGLNDGDTENSGSIPCVTVTNGQDVLTRLQRFGNSEPFRDGVPGAHWWEAQDIATGTWLPYSCGGWVAGCPMQASVNQNISGSASLHGETNGIGNANVAVQVAYAKWFSATVHPNHGLIKSQMVSETTQADLLDLRFENNLNDSSSGAYGFTMTVTAGTPTTSTTSTSHNPYCFLPQQVFNKNFGISTLSPTAYALDPSGPSVTYFWSQTAGTPTLTFSSGTAANPTLTGADFGSYTFALSVTDGSSHTSVCSVKDGFTDGDANNMTTSGNAQIDELIGGRQAMLWSSANPWEWMDDRNIAEQNLQTGRQNTDFNLNTTPPWESALSGKIAVTNGSATVTGFGTHFQTDICTGTVPNGKIVIYYPWAQTVGGHGWRSMTVNSCSSDTSLTMSSAWSNTYLPVSGNSATCTTGAEASCWQYSYISTTTYNKLFEQNSPPNFYDQVMASVALYYRSGIDDYLTQARNLADLFWHMKMDVGNNYYWGEGRSTFYLYLAQNGMAWRAIDCPACNMWAGIEQIAKFANDNIVGQSYPGGVNWKRIGGALNSDPRDMGNATNFMAVCARFDPNASPAGTCRSQLADVMTRGWTPSRFPDGNFYSLYWAGSQGQSFYDSWTSNSSITLSTGSSTGTCSGAAHCPWAPPAPTVTISTGVSGTTTYSYAFADAGLTNAYRSPTGSIATGPASLGGGNSLDVSMPTISGVTYNVYRTAGGGTTGLIGSVTAAGTPTVFNDNGITATGSIPAQGQYSQWATTGGAAPWWIITATSTQPVDNTGSQGVFYPVQTGAGTLQLQDLSGAPVNWTGTSGAYGWAIGGSSGVGLVGYGVQPYMLGFLSNAFRFTETGMRCTATNVPTNCSNTVADNAKTYLGQIANFIMTLGWDSDWRSLLYWQGPQCVRPLPLNSYCKDGDGEVGGRFLNAEGARALINAYSYVHDPAIKNFADMNMQALWYRPGWASPTPDTSGFTYDGHFNSNYSDAVGYCFTGLLASKCWGMPWGLGSNAVWPYLRLQVNPPGASLCMGCKFTGATRH